MVKTFLQWLILINDSNVTNLVNLMESFDSVLNQFSELDS